MTAQTDAHSAWLNAHYPASLLWTFGSAGNDAQVDGEGPSRWDGGGGDDFFQGAGGNDVFFGNIGNDFAYGGTGQDYLDGSQGNDVLSGKDGDDVLIGGYGYDALIGGAGNDLLFADEPGGAFEYGFSTAGYTDATGGVTVDLRVADVSADLGYATGAGVGYDRLGLISNVQGSSYNDIMWGNSLANVLEGRDGWDTLSGDWGDDHLWGEFGVDELWGNQGNDYLHGGDLGDYLNGQEDNDRAWGDNGNDTVWGFDGNDTLSGGANDDQVNGEAGNDEVWGDEGNDTLTGGADADRVSGGLGDDQLDGGLGLDTMSGNAGNDLFFVDSIYDEVIEFNEPGTDQVISRVSFSLHGQHIENLTLRGSANLDGIGNILDNNIAGNAGHNFLAGWGGNDTIAGSFGNDTMEGGTGNDKYVLSVRPGDVVVEQAGAGIDLITCFTSRTLMANVENLDLLGNNAASGLGNNLNNIIDGNSGANNLNGLGGNDTLSGGSGADTFSFSTIPNSASNRDRITDFSVAADSIRLDNAVYTTLGPVGTLEAARFVVGAAAADAADRIIYNSANGRVFYDADGTGAQAQVRFATLSAGLAMTNADFLIF